MNNTQHKECPYMTLADFLKGAKDCAEVDNVFDELEAELNKQPLDEAQLRRQEDWSILANQVVGAESHGK